MFEAQFYHLFWLTLCCQLSISNVHSRCASTQVFLMLAQKLKPCNGKLERYNAATESVHHQQTLHDLWGGGFPKTTPDTLLKVYTISKPYKISGEGAFPKLPLTHYWKCTASANLTPPLRRGLQTQTTPDTLLKVYTISKPYTTSWGGGFRKTTPDTQLKVYTISKPYMTSEEGASPKLPLTHYWKCTPLANKTSMLVIWLIACLKLTSSIYFD